ncbi:hypothetical protein PMZ80_008093 [Knufia obscura]|uniref:F-box domain-containing protein n=1 Tax=Knufia obscura TaxID=1635080 RepID=A0ABR0RHP7_9EURO|nr:hypothetical protein PMZ80_008093 [Knufia obscura]
MAATRDEQQATAIGSKPCLILGLPDEILNTILSYVITVPWHPLNATYPQVAVQRLFGANMLFVTRRLRQMGIGVIATQCLWIRVTCHTSQIHALLRSTLNRAPVLRPPERALLPVGLPHISIDLGLQSHRQNTNESSAMEGAPSVDQSVIFPYNPHTYAKLYAKITDHATVMQSVVVQTNELPPRLQRIADSEIIPLLVLDQGTSYARSTFCNEIITSDLKPRVDRLMSMIQQLDKQNLRLQATLLCMYRGYTLHAETTHNTDIQLDLGQWTQDLATGNRMYHTSSVERMRLVRTIHYIEHRACMGFLEAAELYGLKFCKAHVHGLLYLPDHILSHRWTTEPHFRWFGLPDHELAELHYARALLHRHYVRYCKVYAPMGVYMDRAPSTIELASLIPLSHQTRRYAFHAWCLNSQNTTYRTMLRNMPYDGLEMQVAQRRGEYQTPDGTTRTWGGHWDFTTNWKRSEDVMPYFDQAQQIGRLAPVEYDSRRGDELPRPFDWSHFDADVAVLLGEIGSRGPGHQWLTFDHDHVIRQDRRKFTGWPDPE